MSNNEIPDFNKNTRISVITYIINMNIEINLLKLYEILTVTENFVVIPKKRGRKVKQDIINPNKDIPKGSIITVFPLKGSDLPIRGIDPKNNKRKKKKKNFSNAISINMWINPEKEKHINFKVFKNSKIEMAGATSLEMAKDCVRYFWNNIQYNINENNIDKTTLYNIKDNDNDIKIYFKSVMCNIGFNIGFMVDRNKIDYYFNKNTDFRSLWDNNLEYAGVVIKIPTRNIDNIMIDYMFTNDEQYKDNWKISKISINKHENKFPPISDKKKNKKYTSFFVFHTGKVNMSSRDYSIMKDHYMEFYKIILESKDFIIETQN